MRQHEKYGLTIEEWKELNKKYGVRNYGGRKTKEQEQLLKALLKFRVRRGTFIINFE